MESGDQSALRGLAGLNTRLPPTRFTTPVPKSTQKSDWELSWNAIFWLSGAQRIDE